MDLKNKFMIIPKEKLTVNKLILLCLKKLEIGQVIDNVFQMSNSVELNFEDDMAAGISVERHYSDDNDDNLYSLEICST